MNEKLDALLPDIDFADHNPLDEDQLAIRIETTYQAHDEPEYWETRNIRDEALDLIELIRLRIDRLKLLVALAGS